MKKLVLPVITLIIGLIAGYYFSKSNTVTAEHTGPYVSQNSISREEAQMLVDTFGKYGMQDADHKPDGKGQRTRSSWIPLTELDTLCAALDAERKINGKTDGIRIYFGRYPKLHPDRKTPYEMAYHNTIILVSTKDTSITPKGATASKKIHIDYFGSANPRAVLNMFGQDPLNRTELCPDNCDGATLVWP